jgi:hypothetical protein
MKLKKFSIILCMLCLLLSVSLTAFAADTDTEFVSEKITLDGNTYTTTSPTEAAATEISGGAITIPETVTGSDGTFYKVTAIANSAGYNKSINKLTLPKTVRTIGDSAFEVSGSSNPGVVALVIPEDSQLEHIGSKAFYGSKKLTELYLPGSLRTVGERAFENANALTTVTVAKGATTLGAYMFSDCDELTTVKLPSTLESIGAKCFDHCKKLASIDLPENLKFIGDQAFGWCTITHVTLPPYVEFGGAFTYSDLSSVTFMPGRTEIPDRAFFDCRSLNSITLPNTIVTIGSYAFNCPISSIEFPDSLRTISDNAFPYVKSVYIPETVESVGSKAFSTAEYVKYHETTQIADDAFPSDVYRDIVGPVAEGDEFTDVDGVFTYRVIKGTDDSKVRGEVEVIGSKYALQMRIPEVVEYKGKTLDVVAIGENAFPNAISTPEALPDSIRRIESHAFDGNSKGLKLELPNVVYIGDNAFNGSGLLEITMPNVKHIGDNAFSGTSLSKITLAYNLEHIGKGAFRGCQKLTTVNCFAEQLTEIPDEAFAGCIGLTAFSVPSGVTSIGVSAFKNCTSLAAFGNSSNSLESIGAEAFSSCISLSSMDFKAPLKSIGDSAFTGSGIAEVKLPNTVEYIGAYAFFACRPLEKLEWENGAPENLELGAKAFANNSQLSYPLVLPACKLGDNAFSTCTGLTSVQFEGEVEWGLQVFSSCSKLQNVSFIGNSEIGERAFSSCTKLNSVSLGSVTHVKDKAFENCTALASVQLNSVEVFGDGVFSGCTKISELTFPPSVKSMGSLVINTESPLNYPVKVILQPMVAPVITGGLPFPGPYAGWEFIRPDNSIGYRSGGWERYFPDSTDNGGGSNGLEFEQDGIIYDGGDVETINVISQRHDLEFTSCDPAGWTEAGLVTWTDESPKRIKTLDFTVPGAANLSAGEKAKALDMTNLAELSSISFPQGVYSSIILKDCVKLSEVSMPDGGITISSLVLSNTGITDASFLNGVDSIEVLNVSGCGKLTTISSTNLPGLKSLQAANSGLTVFVADNTLTRANLTGCSNLKLLVCPTTAGVTFPEDYSAAGVYVKTIGEGNYSVVSAEPSGDNFLVRLKSLDINDNGFVGWKHNGWRSEETELEILIQPGSQLDATVIFGGYGGGNPYWPIMSSNSGSNGEYYYTYKNPITGEYEQHIFDEGDVITINNLINYNDWEYYYKLDNPVYWEMMKLVEWNENITPNPLVAVNLPSDAVGTVNLHHSAQLQAISGGGPEVEVLDLSQCWNLGRFNDVDLSKMTGLVYLSFSDCISLKSDSLRFLPATLKTLNLSGCSDLTAIPADQLANAADLNTLLCCGTKIAALDLSRNPELSLLVCDDTTTLTGVPEDCAVVRVKTQKKIVDGVARGRVTAYDPKVTSEGNMQIKLVPAEVYFSAEFDSWTETAGNTLNGNELLVTIPRGSTENVTATYVDGVDVSNMGDVDGSGAINALDVMKLARYVKNSEKYPLGDYVSRGDVDGSGSINALDVMKLARYVKNSEKYPLQ